MISNNLNLPVQGANSKTKQVANACVQWDADLSFLLHDEGALAAHHLFDAASDDSDDFTPNLCDLFKI